MKSPFKVILVVFFLSALSGCVKPPEEPKPSPTELRYDTKRTLDLDKSTSEYRGVFTGTRCYSTNASGTSIEHKFKFDDDADSLLLTIADTDGLFPGDSYGYVLQHIDQATSKTLQTWRIEVTNPESATKKKYYFDFPIGKSQKLTWDSNQPVQGLFRFGTTNRAVAVDLEFKVGNTVNLLSACAPND